MSCMLSASWTLTDLILKQVCEFIPGLLLIDTRLLEAPGKIAGTDFYRTVFFGFCRNQECLIFMMDPGIVV